jgi:hypothetical protein
MLTDYIILQDRGAGDRLGAQLTWYIAQIIYAHYHSYYIDYNSLVYPNSIFIKALQEFIDDYNKNKIKRNKISIIDSDFWCCFNSKVVIRIESDLISYFRKHLFIIRRHLDNLAVNNNYHLYFNPNETILVHLRLDDVDFNNRIDYDGSYSLKYFANKINENDLTYNDENQYYIKNNIIDSHLYNAQAPISDNKLNKVINNIKKRYPYYKVVIITSPKGNVTLNYPTIRTDEPSIDLFYLCNSKILILSRSTYALSTLYFTRAKEIWIPTWGYVSSLGIETKYNNITYNYFN